MMKIKIDYRNMIYIILIIGSLLMSIFYFRFSFYRLLESFTDIANSCVYYFSEVFELNIQCDLTVINLTKLDYTMPFNLPNNWDEFLLYMNDYWSLFGNQENFFNYLIAVGEFLFTLNKFLLIIIPIITIAFILIKVFVKDSCNNNYNKDSKKLIRWKKLENKYFIPTKKWVKNFYKFSLDNSFYLKILLVIWLYNFNAFAIIIEFVAYYLFYVTCLANTTIYVQVLKLLIDLSVVINFFSPFIWCMIIFFVIDFICKKIGKDRLYHMENMNRG